MKRIIILITIIIMLMPAPAFAQDEQPPEPETIYGCTNPDAVNYIDYSEFGYRVIDDGSCYYLRCDEYGACWEVEAQESNYNDFIANCEAIINGIPIAIDQPEVASALMAESHDFTAWLAYLETMYRLE